MRYAVLPILMALLIAGCSKSADTSSSSSDPSADTMQVAAPDAVEGMPADTSTMTQKTASNQMSAETNLYEIITPKGTMVIRLYDETPKHRDNFKKLVAEGYYNGTTFHRVIEGFMIQGGDELSKDDDPLNDGTGGPGYTVDAEIQSELFHKKGALAAARQGDNVNPQRRSSGSQFYIVHGTVMNSAELDQLETQMKMRVPGFSLSADAKKSYSTVGGTPFLDGQYTVFGELVEGEEVLDAIAGAETANKRGERVHPALGDQPSERITMEVRPVDNRPVQ